MSNIICLISVLLLICHGTNILHGVNGHIEFQAVASKLVYTTNNNGKIQYNLNEDSLNLITSISSNEPFNIISTIGQSKNGKSFTLNHIIQKITGTQINPFKTSDEMDACTYGIWMFILPKCSKSNLGGSYVEIDNNGKIIPYLCTTNDKPYLFLDIEGSDTETDDQSLRYATIVTLLSSQTFLFLHRKLYKHDFDHIYHINTIISKMNSENIDFSINDINLGVLIREPGKTKQTLET
eukprot:418620_1